ncbi:uncharacterized protein BDV14DRAFT_25529 [Aspergillus stella-maris]|uniref:uncharacterized protein n=1 Tax=Aspergillus stella-maris TaxID=1810926 RepID=UPI003CCE05C2
MWLSFNVAQLISRDTDTETRVGLAANTFLCWSLLYTLMQTFGAGLHNYPVDPFSQPVHLEIFSPGASQGLIRIPNLCASRESLKVCSDATIIKNKRNAFPSVRNQATPREVYGILDLQQQFRQNTLMCQSCNRYFLDQRSQASYFEY